MNMIVCTCDICGKEIAEWRQLNINFPPDFYKKEICNDCWPDIQKQVRNFVSNLTGDEINDE